MALLAKLCYRQCSHVLKFNKKKKTIFGHFKGLRLSKTQDVVGVFKNTSPWKHDIESVVIN